MQPFTELTSIVIPLLNTDIDTDQIIPASYLKVTDKSGLAEGLFYRWRYQPDGQPDPEFPLNQAQYQGARILLAGDNFGCGSSREHAPWALVGWGIRAVISTTFADIFRNNALKNGLLPVTVTPGVHRRLSEVLAQEPATRVKIDLATQTIVLPDGETAEFPIDAFNKSCLLEGVDTLGYLLRRLPQIAAYEQAHAR
jgi:3-isopropylmalate/(R)-2-methylmalate dehydratase small subunit